MPTTTSSPAFIKSMRGSDPDAALFRLHLMIEAGEDPEFIARRLIVLASEDVGLADTPAHGRWLSPPLMPSPWLAYPKPDTTCLTNALYLATAPKSNSIGRAMGESRQLVRRGWHRAFPVIFSPPYLCASLDTPRVPCHPHDYPGGVVRQQYSPRGRHPRCCSIPGLAGDEGELGSRLAEIDSILGREGRARPGDVEPKGNGAGTGPR